MKEVLKFITCLLILNGIAAESKDRYYPRYHLAPPSGWMNDPNGFCIFKNEYHMFYQYNPKSSQEPGIAHWGHAKSKDLFHWEHLPIALYPNETYDDVGVFSGSALVEHDTMYFFYTGNAKTQTQALATSTDGINVVKYENNPIIIGADRQPNLRDPKVWKHDGKYYMVLGNSFKKDDATLGRVLLYSSDDKNNWEEVAILDESDGSLGYMWECPDFFELNGKFVLLFSPQGIEPQGDLYKNLYQTGYIVGDFDYDTNFFKPITKFVELDRGHDFYATQTIVDKHGHRIVVAWFDMWEQDYPERNDGFTGLLTIPRTLSLTRDNVILQKPVREVSKIRGKMLSKGLLTKDEKVSLKDKTAEIIVTARRSTSFDVVIEANDGSAKVTLQYDSSAQTVTLERDGSDGERRAHWKPKGLIAKWQIFVDASSVELFCGDGELTFSSRFFPNDDVFVSLVSSNHVHSFVVHSMERSVTDVTLSD